MWEPLACLGGVLWCTGTVVVVSGFGSGRVPGMLTSYPTRPHRISGNVMVVPIVKCIGLGLGLVLWNTACMLAGALCGVPAAAL